METNDEQRAQIVERLERAGCIAAHEEADLLIAATSDVYALDSSIARRESGEPLAWIIGSIDFGGRSLIVDPGVYVPRVQSEELARQAATRLSEREVDGERDIRAADLCTGAGAIARSMSDAVPAAVVVGVDRDPRAVTCARRNGVVAVIGDLASPLRSRSFEVVTAVAPYVPDDQFDLLPIDVRRHESQLALDGGVDGLDVVRRVVADAGRVLRAGGWLLIELGGDQDELLEPDLAAAGFLSRTVWEDEEGDLRGLSARLDEPTDRTAPTAT